MSATPSPIGVRTDTPRAHPQAGPDPAPRAPGFARRTTPVLLAAGAVAAFHAAHARDAWGILIAAFPALLVPLVRVATPRRAFYSGFALGFAVYGPPLAFFWTIFGPAAVALWAVLAFWLGVFLALGHALAARTGGAALILGIPVLWTGLEYFRSELYFLRFSWLTPGLALAWNDLPGAFRFAGVHGVGFLLALGASLATFARRTWRWTGALPLAALLLAGGLSPTPSNDGRPLRVAGAQVEGVDPANLPAILDPLITHHPDAELVMLPEYSLDGPPDEALREWCRRHRRHLLVGGVEPLDHGNFHNTAWILDDHGDLVFQQAKSVPIQFFRDGLPAPAQQVWPSPWGPLGIAICYDLSYTRVMDRLVTLGAEGLLIPTMDAITWGAAQHRLHARVAPARAAEYGLPIVRCASSGISQVVQPDGRVTASAPFSTEVQFFAGTVTLRGPGTRPPDRVLAPLCTGATALMAIALAWPSRRRPAVLSESL